MTLALVAVTSLVSALLLLQDRPVLREGLVLHRDHVTLLGLFGYAFVHGSWGHLIGNMVGLLMLGSPVELRLGGWRYLLLYLAGAAVGGLAFLASPGAAEGVIGASGAVMTMAGALLVLLPRVRIAWFCPHLLLLVGLPALGMAFPFAVLGGLISAALMLHRASEPEEGVLLRLLGFRIVRLPGWLYVGLSLAADLAALKSGKADGVAHATHLWGAAVGLVGATGLLLAAQVRPRDPTLLHLLGWTAPIETTRRELPATRRLTPPRPTARPTPRTTRRPALSFSDFARQRLESHG